MEEKILIEGGKRLSGVIPISGAKNSCLTLMPLALLSGKELILENAPFLSDVDTMKVLLENLGCSVKYDLEAKKIQIKLIREELYLAEYEIVKK